MDFYVSLGKTKAGPYSIETMKEKGYWTPDTLVRSENWTEWKRVADLSESELMDAPVPEEKAEKRRPDFPEAITMSGLSNTEILVLALEASIELEWYTETVTMEKVRFVVPSSSFSYREGEEVTLTIEPGSDGKVSDCSQCSNVQFFAYGKNVENIQNLRETMEEIKASLSPEELARKAKVLEDDLKRPLSEEEKKACLEEKKDSLWSFFIPSEGFMATPILIDLNIFVFIWMIGSGVEILFPSPISLLKWGANFGPLTLTGDGWRVVTCNFIHIGVIHLLMNMYAFMCVGCLLEPLIGSRRMFMSYLLTGLCSAVFSLYIHSEIISAGASGAIFGLYGIFLAFLFFHYIAMTERVIAQYPSSHCNGTTEKVIV